MNIDELINGFNDTDKHIVSKIKAAFRSIPVFIKYLIKIGRVGEIDLESVNLIMYDTDREKIGTVYYDILQSTGPEYFLKYFRGITKEEDGYYFNSNWGLTDVFPNFYRDEQTSIAIGEALGQDWVQMFEIYSDNIDFYYDIVRDLDSQNKKFLKERILYYCGTDKFHMSEFNWYDNYEDYFDERGYFSVYEHIDDIMRLDGLFDMVIDLKVLEDLKWQLTNLYGIAYNESWGDEMQERIWSAFSNYFDRDSLIYGQSGGFKIKINHFKEVLSKYFECGVIDGISINYDDILYSLFNDSGCLKLPVIRILDHPQKSKVDEFLNEYFIDNIG
jgi:hypothetical protein